jgi:hypothetical protein
MYRCLTRRRSRPESARLSYASLDACLVAFRQLSPSVEWRPARWQPEGSHRAPGIFENYFSVTRRLTIASCSQLLIILGRAIFLRSGPRAPSNSTSAIANGNRRRTEAIRRAKAPIKIIQSSGLPRTHSRILFCNLSHPFCVVAASSRNHSHVSFRSGCEYS